MATVLVTGVGGASGIGAIRSLHARTSHEVIGVDMDPQAAGLYLADDGRSVPAASDAAWTDEMRATVEEFDVDVVIPTVDEELAVLSSLLETLPDDVPVLAPRPAVVDVALDKYRASRRLASEGLSVPRTWLATDRAEVPESAYPLLVKPRRGRGSRGIRRVEEASELSVHLEETEYETGSLLVQEFIDGTEYTTSVVATREDRLLGIVPKEAIEKRGSTVLGATRDAPAVADSCRAIHGTLEPAGPMNVQQMVDSEGVPYTIEINPRFSSTSCLTAAAGFDEFDLLVSDALGRSVTAPDGYTTDLYMRRYEDHVFVPGEEFPQRTDFNQP